MTRLLVIASALVSAIALFPLGCAWHAVQVDVAGAGGAGAAPAEVYAPSPLAIEDRMWKWGNTPCEINAPDDGPVKIMLHRGGQVVWHTVQPSDERCSVSFVGARAPDLGERGILTGRAMPGMTTAEVFRVLGAANKVDRTTHARGWTEFWHYGTRRTLLFANGKLESITE